MVSRPNTQEPVDMPNLDRPRLFVDFNEMLGSDLVLLSRDDQKVDSSGTTVTFTEGMRVYLYMPDADESGAPTNLYATGRAELNRAGGWSSSVRWCCRIDGWDQ